MSEAKLYGGDFARKDLNAVKTFVYFELVDSLTKTTYKMKKLILPILTILSISLYSQQYSNYYITANANVNHNVTGNVFEHKTITTIDYGALQLANAQKEKNRLEEQKFADEKQKQIALEIADDPTKAYDYGSWFTISTKDKKKWQKEELKKMQEQLGLKNFRVDYVVPNYLTFTLFNAWQLQNVSKDGVTTDIYIYPPRYNKEKIKVDTEKDFDSLEIGKEVEQPDDNGKLEKIFYHKKDLNRATIFGNKGYKTSLIWEDKYENHITDNYTYQNEGIGDGVTLFVKVRYNGDKDEVDFEKLEGRRYYLKPLIEKIIATAKVSDIEIK